MLGSGASSRSRLFPRFQTPEPRLGPSLRCWTQSEASGQTSFCARALRHLFNFLALRLRKEAGCRYRSAHGVGAEPRSAGPRTPGVTRRVGESGGPKGRAVQPSGLVPIVGRSGRRDSCLPVELGSWSGSGARGRRARGQGPLPPALGGAASQGKQGRLLTVGAGGGSASVATHPTHGNTEAQRIRGSLGPRSPAWRRKEWWGRQEAALLGSWGAAALRGRAAVGEPASWMGCRLSPGLWPGTLQRGPVTISSNGPLLPPAPRLSRLKPFV